jgi:Tfp pilus assembly protein PilO
VKREQVVAARDSIAMLTAQNDSVKRELARGSPEELRRRTEAYRTMLDTLRQLVPERGEVPGLIDAISFRAKSRGVHLAVFNPEPVEPGPPPFDTYRYRLSVIGHYDEIGRFLSDVAGLRRIIVPIDVALVAANPASARALGDTTTAMLEAKLIVKTYVKAGTEGGTSGR